VASVGGGRSVDRGRSPLNKENPLKRIFALTVAAAGAVAVLAAPGANAGSICVDASLTVQDQTVPVQQCVDTP
jgi:hypothetical protein